MLLALTAHSPSHSHLDNFYQLVHPTVPRKDGLTEEKLGKDAASRPHICQRKVCQKAKEQLPPPRGVFGLLSGQRADHKSIGLDANLAIIWRPGTQMEAWYGGTRNLVLSQLRSDPDP